MTFTGVVRRDGGITSMTLEHYPGMTEREIARHIAEAQARWPLLGVTIIHRIGKLAPGDNIVLVAVASSTRSAAFEAAEFLMDYLKTRAPFWKLEERAEEARWVNVRDTDEAAASAVARRLTLETGLRTSSVIVVHQRFGDASRCESMFADLTHGRHFGGRAGKETFRETRPTRPARYGAR